jgi:hypothetical protein
MSVMDKDFFQKQTTDERRSTQILSGSKAYTLFTLKQKDGVQKLCLCGSEVELPNSRKHLCKISSASL